MPWSRVCWVLLALGGCEAEAGDAETTTPGHDAGEESDSGADRADASEPEIDERPGWPEQDAGAGLDDACIYHEDCKSQYCLRYSDVPLDPDRRCATAGKVGDLRVTATVRDLTTREPVADAEVRVVSALGAATNPVAARSLVVLDSDGEGRVDGIAREVNGIPLGLVALSSRASYTLTATGLAAPLPSSTRYPAGNDIHDLWLIRDSLLQAWSDELAEEPALESFLPLGTEGGVIAFLRQVENGEPLAGATIRSSAETSDAVVRYLADDGASFGDEATSSRGLAIILGPSIGEPFTAFDAAGDPISSNLAGSAPGVVMVITMQ